MDRPVPIMRKKHHESTGSRREVKVIYFAVSTTGFIGQDGQICQIAAKHDSYEMPWHVYVCPDNEFAPKASAYNGFTKEVGCDGEKFLLKDGVRVKTHTLFQALKKFIRYVSGIAGSQHTTMLVGWYSKQFHIPILLKELKKCKLTFSALEDAGVCYGDPFYLIKNNPARFPQIAHLSSRRLLDVYQYLNKSVICRKTFDACRIVEMLQSVMSSLGVTNEQFNDCSFSLSSADCVQKHHNNDNRNSESHDNKLRSQVAKNSGVRRVTTTKSLAEKIAKAGLNSGHFWILYRRHGLEGLERILRVPLRQRLRHKTAKTVKSHVTRHA